MIAPGTNFYAVFVGDVHSGFASVTVDTVGRDIRIAERLEVQFPTGGLPRIIHWSLDTSLDPDLQLANWHLTLEGDGPLTETFATVSRGVAHMTLAIDGDTVTRLQRPVGDALPLTAALLRLAVTQSLSRSAELSALVLDPLAGTIEELPLHAVEGPAALIVDSARLSPDAGGWEPALIDTVPSYLVFADRTTSAMYLSLDGQGRAITSRRPNGITVRRTAFEIAQLNFRQGVLAAAPSRRVIGQELQAAPLIAADTMATLFFQEGDSTIAADAAAIVAGAPSFADTVQALLLGDGTPLANREDLLHVYRRTVAEARALGIPARLVGGAVWHGSWAPTMWIEVWRDGWHEAVDVVEPATPRATSERRRLASISGYRFEYEALLSLLPRRP